jgi:ABC-type nickel/cobalt efflux system permease component RcnA
MVACVGVVLQKRAFVAAAFWLSAYSLVFDIVRWYFELSQVRVPVPVTVILYALFMWRIWRVGRRDTVVQETPPTV